MVRRLAQRRLLLPIAAFALSLLSCGREVTGPENGIFRNRIAMLAFEPVFTGPIAVVAGAGDAVPFEKVRVVLRALDGTIVKDTMVDFPSDVDEISLALTIPIPQDAPAEGLPLTVAMAYVNAAGDTVFRGGPSSLTARPVGSAGAGTPVTVTVTYDGTGKNAARVAINPKTGTGVAGQTLAFSATAFDDADQPIANTPFVFSTLDPTRVSVDPVTGVATWLPVRGTARVVAELPNGERGDTATFTVALPAAKLVLGSGGAQTGAVNAALGDSIVVRTLASDDVPVEGVIVTFAVATGAGTLGVLTDTSDANGNVQTAWTLGAPLGAQTITATSAGLTGSPLTIAATAVAGTPTQLDITAQPTTGTAGSALAPSLTVTARDAFGNVATAFTGEVTVGVAGVNPPALGGTVTRAAVGGVATFNDLSLQIAGGYQLVASSGALQPDTTSAITIAAAAAARLAFVQEPLDAAAGADFTPAVTVRAVDAFGNTVPSYAGSVNLTIDAPAGVALLGTLPRAAVAGIATFSNLAVRQAGSGYRLIASATGLIADTSASFGITALAPTVITDLGGDGQSAAAGTVLTDSIIARVTDVWGNPIAGASVSVSVVSGSGSVSGTTLTADATGRVALQWSLGPVLGAQQITLAVPGVPTSTVTVSATATIGAPSQLVFTQAPTAGVAGAALTPAPRIEIRDGFGNLVVTYTGEVTIALDSNPTATALNGTLTVNAVAGVATWPDLSLTAAGSGYTLFATLVTEGVPSAATAPFDVVAATAAQFFVVSGNNQSVVAGSAFTDSLKVRVLDQYGNPKIGHPTTWSENGVVTLGAVGEVLTDSTGTATNTATAGTTVGAQSAGPSVSTQDQGGVIIFEHVVAAAAPSQLVVLVQPDSALAGESFAPSIDFEVRDSFGNRVTSVSDSIRITVESGPPTGTVLHPVIGGRADYFINGAGTLGGYEIEVLGTYQLRITTDGGLTALLAPFDVLTGPAAQFGILSGNNQSVAVSSAFPDSLRVYVRDAFGNPKVGHPTTWSENGVVTLGVVGVVLTDANGIATNSAIAGTGLGAQSAGPQVTTDGVGSNLFFEHTVTAAAATQLVVSQQPPTTTDAGQAFSLTVEARDQFGNLDLAYADSATIVILNGSAGATLGGTTKLAMVNGSVTFSGLTLDKPGSYELAISAPGLSTATTTSTEVVTGAAAAITQASVSNDAQVGVAGDTLAPFRVRVTDIAGNPVSGVSVTWTPTAGGSFVDAVTVTDANGEAESRLVAPQDPGTATAIAEASGLSGSPVSFSASIEVGPASKLAILIAPSATATAGVALTDFTVRAENRFGYPAAYADSMRVSVVDGPVGGGIVAGDTAVLADSSATFTGLTFAVAGSYTLEFRAAGLDSVRYVPITVGAGAAASLTLVSGDAQSGTVLSTLANPFVVEVRDGAGNLIEGASVNWAVTSGDANVTIGTVLTDASGQSQTELVLGTATGSVTVTASLDALTPVEFTATIVAGAASYPDVLTAPTGGTAGVALGSFSYGAFDQYGNLATTYTGTAKVTLQKVTVGDLDPVILSGDSVDVVNGVATWDALVITSAGQYKVVADFGPSLGTYVSANITIDPAGPSTLVNVSGDGQSAVVLQHTASPLRARVTDTYGNAVSGVSVNFNVIDGLATLGAASVPTDASGYAEVSVQMDNVAGPVLVGAFAAGLSPDSVLYTLTALPDAPNALLLVAGDAQTIPAGGTTDSVRVRLKDAYDNAIAGATVTWESLTGLTFSSASSVTDSSGYAATTVIAGGTLGLLDGYARYSPEISAYFTVTVEAGAADSVVFVTEPTGSIAGSILDTLVVELRDAYGNLAKTTAATIELTVDGGLTAGTLGGTLSAVADSGVAKFGDLVLTQSGPYKLVATATGLVADTTAQFDVTASDASSISISGGDGQSGAVGTALANPLEVTLTDAYGNVVPGVAVSWSVISESSVTFDSTDVTTDSAGVARTTATFQSVVGAVDIVASAGDAGSVSFSLEAVNAPAAILTVSAEPTTAVAGTTLGAVSVLALDGLLNDAVDFIGDVTVVVDSGPAGATLGGSTTATAVLGIATFSDLTLDKVGTYRLRFSAAGLADTVTANFDVTVAAAALISIVEGDAQTDTVGAPLATPLRVRVTDAFGNPVSGESLTWTSDPAVTYVGESPIGTDVNGEMAMSVALGTTAGAYTVKAAIAALPDSMVTFNLTALGGTATQLVVASEPGTVVAGDTMTVVVEAHDQYGNVAPTFAQIVTIARNDAPVSGTIGDSTATAVAGVATFSSLRIEQEGSYYFSVFADGFENIGLQIDVIPAAPSALTAINGDNQTGFNTLPLDSAVVVRLSDEFGNPIDGDSIFASVASGGGTINSVSVDTLITDSQGRVILNWTLGAALGTQTLSVSSPGIGPITVTATALQSVANIIWTGAANSTATNPANWNGGVVPTGGDSVLVPAGRTNYPTLDAEQTYGKLTVEDGAQFDVGVYALNVLGDINAAGSTGIVATNGGTVHAAGTGTIVGRFPGLTFEGDYTSAGLVFVDGAMSVDSAFVLTAGDSLYVGGDLRTNGNGQFTQSANTGAAVLGGLTLDGGPSTFAGGARLYLSGDLQTGEGADPMAFVADSLHALYLMSSGTQTIAFYSGADTIPDGSCTASCLGTVYGEQASGGVAFGSSVMAIGGFQVGTSGNVATVDGNFQYVVAGAPSTLRGISGTRFRKFGFTQSYDANAFDTDSLVAFGEGQLPANLAFPTVVAGNYAIFERHGSSLVVEGGLDVDGSIASVAGDFVTRGEGFLKMSDAGDSLVVDGETRFEGLGSSGQLTAGVLEAMGSVFVGGSGALVADSGHVLRFANTSHSLTVTDTTSARFGSLRLENATVSFTGRVLRFSGDVTIVAGGEPQLAALDTARVEIGGRLSDPSGSGMSFLTTVLTGTDAIGTPRVYGTLALRGSNTLADTLLVVGTLQVESGGSLVLGGKRITVDSLFTTGTGTITMADAADSATVLGTALFNGGSSVLTNGRLRLAGRVDGNGGAFAAAPTHTTEFFGSASQQVGFGNPGFGGSQAHFGRIELKKSGSAPFSSTPIYVNGQLVTAAPNQTWQGVIPTSTLNIRGADISYLSLPNQPLVLADGADVTKLDSLRLSGFSQSGVTQLRIERNGGTVNLTSPMFDTTAPSPTYLSATDLLDDADDLTIQVSDPNPAVHGGLVQTSGGARILGWSDFEALVWTGGAGSVVWADPANWAQGRAPVASDSVVVTGNLTYIPTIAANDTIRALHFSTLQAISLDADLTITGSMSGDGEGASLTCGSGGRLVFAATDSLVAYGRFDCPVHVSAGRTLLGGTFQVDSLIIDGSGELHVRNADYVNVSGDLRTADNGTLRMEGSTEAQVSVSQNVIFASIPKPSSLIGGRLYVYGNFVQESSPTAFAASGGHETYFVGSAPQSITFAHPDSLDGSHFASLAVNQSGGEVAAQLYSDVYVEGNLIGDFGSAESLAGMDQTRLLRVRGVRNNSDSHTEFANVRLEIANGGMLGSNLYGFSFVNFGATGAPQLRIARDTGSVTLNFFQFDSAATSPLYLQAEDTDPLGQGTLAVTMNSPTPQFYGSAVDLLGGATLLGWESQPSFTWLSTGNTSWSTATNWSSGVVPSSTSVVTIPSDATTLPAIASGPVTVRGLINESDTVGVYLASGVDLTVTDQLQFTPTGEGATCQDGTARLVIGGNATTLSGSIQGCDVRASGGTASITDSLSVWQTLTLAGDHALDVNGGTLYLQGQLALIESASLVMDDAEDTVTAQAGASFGGGANVLSAGQLTIGANLTITGSGTFVATGSHRTELFDNCYGDCSARQISIADANTAFNDVAVAFTWQVSGAPLTVSKSLDLQTSGIVLSDSAIVVGGDFAGVPGSQVTAPRVAVSADYRFSGELLADTVEFTGTDQAIPATVDGIAVRFPHVLVSGSAYALTADLADTVVADSGVIVTNSGTLTVGDAAGPRTMQIGSSTYFNADLQTLNGGRLAMNQPGAELRVFGTAAFQGGDETGLLTNGRLIAESGFNSTGDNAFVASGAHRTVLGGNGLIDTYTVLDDNGDLRFGTLEFTGQGFQLATSITADTLRQESGGTVGQDAVGQRLTVLGDVVGDGSATLDVRHLSLGGRYEHNGTQTVDTLVLTGSNQQLAMFTSNESVLTYGRVEVTGNVTTDVPPDETLNIGGAVVVRGNGSLRFTSATGTTFVSIAGNLETQDNGVIGMDALGTNVSVGGDALFAGGSTAGLIQDGTLRIAGSFTQSSATSPASFQASGTHETQFQLAGSEPTIEFAAPGYGASESRFNHFGINPDGGSVLTLASDVYNSSQLLHNSISPVTLQQSGGFRTLHSQGAAADYVTFDGVQWELSGSVAIDSSGLQYLSFINQDPTAAQLRIVRDSLPGEILLSSISFGTVPTTGRYLVVEDTVANGSPLTVTVDGASPAFYGTFAETLGEAVLLGWLTEFVPEVNTFAAVEGSWTDTTSWSLGRLPTSQDNVVIPDLAFVTITDSAFARGFTVQGTGSIQVDGVLEVRGNVAFSDYTVGNGVIVLRPDLASVTLEQSAAFSFEPSIEIAQGEAVDPLVTLASEFTHIGSGDAVTVGYGTLGLAGHTLKLSGNFATTGSGRLQMTQAADSLDAIDLRFSGGSTQGLLTDGTIVFSGGFVQGGGAADAFAADAGHLTVATRVSADTIRFTNPGRSGATSRFGSFVAEVPGTQMRFVTPAAIAGSFNVPSTATVSIVAGDTLDVLGSVDVQGTVTSSLHTAALRMNTSSAGANLRAPGSILTPLVLTSGVDATEGVVTLTGQVNLDTLATGTNGWRHGLYLRAGILDVNGQTLHSRGGLRVGGSGILEMNQPTDSVNAEWNVIFAGPDNEGYLTDGVLVANSSAFYQADSVSAKSFVATGNHRTVFAGGNTQIDVDFASSSATTSRFASVRFAKSQYNVNFYTDPFPGDTVFAQTLDGISSDVYIDGGSLVVLGGVSGDTTGTWYMEGNGIVRIEGVDDFCNGFHYNVQNVMGNFIPSGCHTPTLIWTSYNESLDGRTFNAVTATSATRLVAVGDSGTLGYRFFGGVGDWNFDIPSGTTRHLNAISHIGDDVWAAGDSGVVVRWINGQSPTVDTLGDVHLRGILAIAADSIYAIGDGGSIYFFNGAGWQSQTSGTASDLLTIQFTFKDGLVAAGAAGTILSSTGDGSWTAVSNASSTVLRAISDVDETQYFLGGDAGTVLQRTGSTVSDYGTRPSAISDTIFATTKYDNQYFFVGQGGRVLRKLGNSWTIIGGPTTETLRGATVIDNLSNGYFIVVVGRNGTVYHAKVGTSPPA